MKRQLCLLILCLPLMIMAQDSVTTGIKWTTNLSWEQVKEKAKKENKYIFLDCYATWCGPCKAMDKYVYPNDTVGQFFNDKFISVKVQMDKTKIDNEDVKKWYTGVKELNERYVIEGYPSFLIFAPDGKAVCKEAGYKEVLKLMKMANWALVTDDRIEDIYEKYTRLIQEFKNGKITYEELPFLVTNAKKRGDTISRQIFRVHEEYVSKLPKKERYTKGNIEFWSTLNLMSDRNIVQFFYHDGKLIDKVMGKKGYAAKQVDKCIQNFIVMPFINKSLKDPDAKSGVTTINTATGGLVSNKNNYDEADWKDLEKQIRKDFSALCAKRNLLKAKATWYEKSSNWVANAKANFKSYRKCAPDFNNLQESVYVNTVCWNVFSFVNDKKIINEAIKWMGKQVQQRPTWSDGLDTYANLLYKLGRNKEAISWEQSAVANNPTDQYNIKALEQMKKGEPTYGVQPLVINK